jgi:hypothetical protein
MQISEKVHVNEKDQNFIVEKVYDNQYYLDRAEYLRNNKLGVTGESKLAGTIPMHVMGMWCKEAGIRWEDLEARKEIVRKKLLSGEFDKLRVWKGKF